MPIKVTCQCGKSLAVKDQFAGKTVKCPECGQGIQVPVGGAAAPVAQPAPAAQSIGTVSAGDPMSELFDQEGFDSGIAAVCPNCAAPMAPEAVLCTKCGFNKTTGEIMQGHLVEGVDISSGAMALQKAADDMRRADKLQKDMTEKAGLPWWGLALVLFVLCSATSIGVMALMSANRVTGESGFNPMRVFCQLAGAGCAMVSFGAFIKLVVAAFRESRLKGALSLLVLYLFIFVFQQPRGRIGAFMVMLVFGGIAGGLLAYSQQV